MLENSTHLLSKGGWPGPHGGGRTRGATKAVPVVLNPWPQWLGPEPGRSPNRWAGGTHETGGLVTAPTGSWKAAAASPATLFLKLQGHRDSASPPPLPPAAAPTTPVKAETPGFLSPSPSPHAGTCTQPRNLLARCPRGRRQQDQQQQGTTHTGDSEGPGQQP